MQISVAQHSEQQQMQDMGLSIPNAQRGTSITCFAMQALPSALQQAVSRMSLAFLGPPWPLTQPAHPPWWAHTWHTSASGQGAVVLLLWPV